MARCGDGLYLRGKTWYLDCRINGVRHQIKLGKHISRSVAKELALVKRTQILKSEAGIGNKRKDCSFMKAKEEFLKWTVANKRPRTLRTYRQCLDHLSVSFDGKRLSNITGWLIEKHKQRRAKAEARVRANREVAVLKTLFNYALRMGLFRGSNPVVGVRLFKEEQRKLRYLEPSEEQELLQQLKEPLRTLAVVGIHCGIRIQSEGLPLKWEHIDLGRNLLTVEAAYAKNGEHRMIPLNSTARLALDNLRQLGKNEYVFSKNGQPYRSIRSSFGRACQRAHVKDVSPHTLRHTFASRLAMSGVDLRTIQELGGWKDLGLLMRYAHLSPNHKAQAVERIAEKNSTTLFTTPEKEERVKLA